MRKHLFPILLILVISGTTYSVEAQTGHHWTQQYGTKSMLLSGSVIGGVEDLGAVYYNPARISMVENLAFLLSADVQQWTTLDVEDAFGNNTNFSQSEFRGVPSLAAGTFNIKALKNHYFAYAILTRTNSNLNFSFRGDVMEDVIEEAPGEELFGAEVSLPRNSKETWIGGSWSHQLNNKLGIGFSGFLARKEQSRGTDLRLNALFQDSTVALYRFDRNYSMSQESIIGKFGLAYQLGKTDLGLTVTTPGLKLRGKGNYSFEEFLSGVEGISGSPDIYTTTYQDGLSTNIKDPWSVGVGLAFPVFQRSKIFISSEWFSSIPQHIVLRTQDYASQSDPSRVSGFELIDEARSIINAGIGAEMYLSEKVSGYVSMSTDFSTAPSETVLFTDNERRSSNTTIKADYYHFGSGVVLKFAKADITLGATYAGAQQDFSRPVDFPEDGGGTTDIIGSEETSTATIRRWRFVFSFSLPFVKDYAKKLEQKFNGGDDEEG